MENLLLLAWSAFKSVVPPTVFLLAIGWLCRAWIGEKLKASIKHEYDDRLEQLKAELRAQGDSNLTLLKSEIDRQADKLRIASSSFTEVQKATIPKRIEAVESLWLAVLDARELFPSGIKLSDILVRSELLSIYQGPLGEGLRKIEFDLMIKFFGKVENHRPFLGEVIWALFATYHAMLGRVVYLFREGRAKPERLIWYEDENIHSLINAALGSGVLDEFKRQPHSRLRWLNLQFDKQLFQAFDQLLSGQEFGAAALRHAEATLVAVSKAELHP